MNNNNLVILDADDDSDRISRIERSSVIEPGHYWRCTKDTEGVWEKREESAFHFREGDLYLLTRLEYFDGKLHSVVLLDDPMHSTTTGLLTLEMLLAGFEQVDDEAGKAHRALQIAAIQEKAAEVQREMTEAQTNPALMQPAIEEGLRKWERDLARERRAASGDDEDDEATPKANLPTVTTNGRFDLAAAVEHKITSTDIEVFRHMAQREGKIAEIKGKWLQEKVEHLGRVLKLLTPFFSEHAAIGMARAHDALTLSKDVEKGLRSLRLYTGEGVEVVTLLEGESAPASEPLTVYQRKLFMAEEFAVWDDVDRMFDYTHSDVFFEALAANEGLRNQLIPAPRGVVAMAVRRSDVNYGAKTLEAAMLSERKNAANKALFLLVRDGGNWYQVFSDEPSHELSPRLFPTRNEMDRLFAGLDGERIGFEDLRFTNRTNDFDRKSLTYKRFLILACGLDHRKKLFGQFYPERDALSFISMSFQQKYMRFIADDDSDVMLGDDVGSVGALIAHNHGQLAAGCRVVVFSKELLEQEAAPGAFNKGTANRDGSLSYTRMVQPLHKAVTLTVHRDKDNLVVHLPVRRLRDTVYDSWRGHVPVARPEFNVKVALNKLSGDSLGYLVADTLRAEELKPFIYNRRSRAHHTDYIYGFKLAMQMLGTEEAANASVMAELNSLAKNRFGLAAQAAGIAATSAAQSWRLKNTDAEALPQPGSEGFDTLDFELAEAAYAFTHALPKVTAYIEQLGGKVVRVMRAKKGVLVAYYEQPEAEKDPRIANWLWVGRRTFTPAGKPTKDEPQTVWLRAGRIVGETELMSAPSELAHNTKELGNRVKLINFLNKVDEMADILTDAFKGERQGVSDRAWLALSAENPERVARHKLNRGGHKFDRDHEVLLPVGVKTDTLVVLGIRVKVYDLLYFYGSAAQRAALVNQGYTLPKQRKDLDGKKIPYEGIRFPLHVDAYAHEVQYFGPLANDTHFSSGRDYDTWDHSYEGENRLDHNMAYVLAYDPEAAAAKAKRDPWGSSKLDPARLYIPRPYRDETGGVKLSRLFPGQKLA